MATRQAKGTFCRRSRDFFLPRPAHVIQCGRCSSQPPLRDVGSEPSGGGGTHLAPVRVGRRRDTPCSAHESDVSASRRHRSRRRSSRQHPFLQGGGAHADPPEYHVIDVHADLPGHNEQEPLWSQAYGMNDDHAVVGQYKRSSSAPLSAFLWLPEPAFELDAGGYDLNDLLGLPPENSIAHDINERGQVAGQYDGVPVVWDLSTLDPSDPNSEYTFINLSALTEISAGIAYAVNEQNPAHVVGYTVDVDDCIDGHGDPGEHLSHYAFRVVLGSQLVAEILPEGTQGEIVDSEAHGISPGTQTLDSFIAGSVWYFHDYALTCPAGLPTSCPPNWSENHHGQWAYWWNSTGNAALPLIDSEARTRHRAYDANDAGQFVGYGEACINPGGGLPVGLDRPVFWSGSGPEVLPVAPDSQHRGRAYAISETDGPMVGDNVTADIALRWTIASGGATVLILHDATSIGAGCAAIWTLESARDISQSGAIVGWGEREDFGNADRAYMLLEVNADCPEDLTGDGCVGGADMGILLSAWGVNPCHPADLNGDGTVGGADLGTLTAAWGPCPGSEGCEEEDPPEFDESNSSDYQALFIWLIEQSEPELALQFADVTALSFD